MGRWVTMPEPVSVSHVEGCTVVRASVSAPVGAIGEAARAHLLPGSRLALDLHGHGGDSSPLVSCLTDLAASGRSAGAELVVVTADVDLRRALAAAGIDAVYESLDDAVGDTAPVLRDSRTASAEPMYPAQGDATLVASEDVSGTHEH